MARSGLFTAVLRRCTSSEGRSLNLRSASLTSRFPACSRVPLGRQTRVFVVDSSSNWRCGARRGRTISADGRAIYYIRLPNRSACDLQFRKRPCMRWDKPPRHPLDILTSGGSKLLFRDARLRGKLLLQDRASTRPHRRLHRRVFRCTHIKLKRRIIRDPVQDSCSLTRSGSGKTIEAGFVIQQTLIDDPTRKVGVVLPRWVVEQWRAELRDKFYLGRARVKVVGHGDIEG